MIDNLKISICTLFLALVGCKANVDETGLIYRISSTLNDPISPRLNVKFNHTSDENGLVVLKYENDSWGQQNLFDCIKDFEVHPEPVGISFVRDSSLIKVRTHASNEKIEIAYSIIQDFENDPLNEHRYRPIVNEKFFHLLGMRLFILPDEITKEDSNRFDLRVIYYSEKDTGIFHSSFGPERDFEINVNREELYASIFVGGDFRKYEFDYKGTPIFFLTRGDWKHLNEENVVEILRSAMLKQIEFWKDSLDKPYSVTLLPTCEEWAEESKSSSMGGSGLTDSFISFASNNPGITEEDLSWLYFHELFHRWVGQKIKNEEEEKQYWFSEGFTNYYTYKLMLKNDLITADNFIQTINEQIIEHENSKLKNVSNADITKENFWSDYEYQKLPYRRGLLYAFYLDNQIKKVTSHHKSLDNLMLDLLSIAKSSDSMRLNKSVFLNALSKYTKDDIRKDFEKYITLGEPIEIDQFQIDGWIIVQNNPKILALVGKEKDVDAILEF